MDLGQIGFEKAQAMMPYLRAMLRNVEREIVSSRESSSTLIMNEGSRDPISSDEEAPSTAWKEDEMIAAIYRRIGQWTRRLRALLLPLKILFTRQCLRCRL
jgi:hypothetical protein